MAGKPSASSTALATGLLSTSLDAATSNAGVDPSTKTVTPVAPMKLSSQFTKSQLALALTIQKSKPENLSTKEILIASAEDYCLHLKKRMRTGRGIVNKDHRYVDTHEFWKDQYSKIHLEKIALEEKIQRLEEEKRFPSGSNSHDGSHAEHHYQLIQDLVKLSSASNINNQMLSSSGSRKRQAQSQHVMEWLAGHDDQAPDPPSPKHDIYLTLSNYILRIARQRSNLQELMKDTSRHSSIDDIIKFSRLILRLVDNAFSDCCLPMRLSKTNDDDPQSLVLFQLVMKQIVLSFQCCFDAMNELCLTIPGRQKKSDLICPLVMFFSNALKHLRRVSFLQAEDEFLESRRQLHKPGGIDREEYAVSKYLAKALVSIANNIEWKIGQPGHSDVLEGILFTLLDNTGRLVSEVTFNEHVAKSKSPGNITKEKEQPQSREVTQSAIMLESRYLLQVLEAALGGSTRKDLITRVLAGNAANVGVLKHHPLALTVHTGDLLTKVKKRLQETLVKCAVGGVDLNSLRLPSPPDDDLNQSVEFGDSAEEHGPERFIDSVWSLVGWELLV